MEDVLAVFGIFFFMPLVWFFAFSAVGKNLSSALADRLRGVTAADPQLRDEVDQLRTEVDHLRLDLHETQERLDFAERLLASRSPAAEGESR